MDKRGQWIAPFAVALADILLVNLAFVLAWYIRYQLEWLRDVPEEFYVGLSSYYPLEAGLTVILLGLYWAKGLYKEPMGRSWLDEASIIFSATTTGIAILVIAGYFVRPFAFSRLIFVYIWVLVLSLLSGGRLVKSVIRDLLISRGIGLRRVVIAGGGPTGRMVMRSILARPNLGYRAVGFLDGKHRDDLGRFRYLGGLDDLPNLVRQREVDEVIIALPSASHKEILEILGHCETNGVRFHLVPDFYELSLDRVGIQDLDGIPLIGLRETSLKGAWIFAKRTIDILVAAVLLVILALPIALLALAIRLESPGPVLFRQVRVGRGGKTFEAYKFRSMRVGAEEEQEELLDKNESTWPLFKIKKDPRLTRVGRFMRRLSLDELAQLFNVLQGHMSLVGPRPPLPKEVIHYADWHKKRLEVSPGITGLWQVSGRSDLPFDEMVLLDLWYIENWSLGLDLGILLRTLPVVVLGKGAY